MEKLDPKDKKILYELDQNCRQTDSQISRKVKLSRDSVRYRINKLLDQGYINYFMVILNSMKLGYKWYRTFFRFQNLTLEKEEEILNWLKKEVSWITKVEGPWDLNTGIFCETVYGYRDFINSFLIKYGNYIEEYKVAVVIRMWHYRRDYLLDKKTPNPIYGVMGYGLNEDYSSQEIDKTDYKILQVLLKNARMNIIDIAKKVKTTEMVVKHRIKKLQEKGIILGFRPFLNIKKLGYLYFKVHFSLRNLSSEKKEKIFSYIHSHPNTVHTTELVGGADLETEFQVKDNEELYSYIKEIRSKFGEMIKDYEFMQYTDEIKFTYLPEMKF